MSLTIDNKESIIRDGISNDLYGIEFEIKVSGNVNEYEVDISCDNVVSLDFFACNNTAQISGFKVSSQRSNIGKIIMRNMMEIFEDLQVDNLKVIAGDKVGGYFWARAGFLPKQEGWNELRERFSGLIGITVDRDEAQGSGILTVLEIKNPKAIWLLADSTIGKELLLGTKWDGSLDMKNQQAMDRFNAYVGQAKFVDRANKTPARDMRR